jgi:DNA modification methylase
VNELAGKEAYENFSRTVNLKRLVNGSFIELASLLRENRDRKYYEVLGYASFEAYIASPELSFRRRSVYDFIAIYEKFVIECGVQPAALIGHEWTKLAEILPYVTNENYEELLSEVETLSRSDLRLKLKEDRRRELALKNALKVVSGIRLYNEDFRNSDVFNIDVIITDPPYPSEYLPLWQDLFDFASKRLKPSGFLITYSGELNLDKIMKMDFKGLNYYWTFCLYHMGGEIQLILPRNIICRWKPILIFQKPPFKKMETVTQDYGVSESREKNEHEWQQSESGVLRLIEAFSEEGDTLVDPFAGSGTFLKVARDLRRNAIGYEVDETTYNIAKGKLA